MSGFADTDIVTRNFGEMKQGLGSVPMFESLSTPGAGPGLSLLIVRQPILLHMLKVPHTQDSLFHGATGLGWEAIALHVPATTLPPLSIPATVKEETELERLLMLIIKGIGGFGDDGIREEDRDAAVLETGESNTDNGKGMTKSNKTATRQEKTRKSFVPNLGND